MSTRDDFLTVLYRAVPYAIPTIRPLNCTNKSQIVCWMLNWMKPESDNISLCAQRTSGKCWFITPIKCQENTVAYRGSEWPSVMSSSLGLNRCLMESVSKFLSPSAVVSLCLCGIVGSLALPVSPRDERGGQAESEKTRETNKPWRTRNLKGRGAGRKLTQSKLHRPFKKVVKIWRKNCIPHQFSAYHMLSPIYLTIVGQKSCKIWKNSCAIKQRCSDRWWWKWS